MPKDTAAKTGKPPTRGNKIDPSKLSTKRAQNPCKEYGGDGWLWSHKPNANKFDLTISGKWLLFVSCSNSSSGWKIIKEATEKGILGHSAKVSREDNTSSSRPKSSAGPTHLFCIYTYDWRDVADVLRVGQTLVDIGAVSFHSKSTFYYKADIQTLAGIAGSIFQFRAPYTKLESTHGLIELSEREPAALQVLSLLQNSPE